MDNISYMAPSHQDQENESNKGSASTLVVDETSEERNKARLAISELALMTNVPMALYAAVRLNVADAIWDDGANVALMPGQILSRIAPLGAPADPENLQRILRMLSSYGVFNECLSPTTMERRYSLTEVGKTLVTDGEGLSYGAYVLQHNLDAMMKAWPLMHTVVLDPSTEPFVRSNGDPPYTYYKKDEEMNKLMQRAMSGASVPFIKALLGSGYDGFDRVGTLVDVGGSAGDSLRIILEKRSDIKEAINFDLPEVLAKAPRIPGITYVGGDMFKSILRGDVIFEKLIFSTWTDDEVKQIIRNCYEALPTGGKLIACEPALSEQSDSSRRTRVALQCDVFVMTMHRAKEKIRTEHQYKYLGLSAGFSQFRALYFDH